MAVSHKLTSEVPSNQRIIDSNGMPSMPWGEFFRWVYDSLFPLGNERYFEIANNVSIAADVKGLSFDKDKINCALVDYLIQRVSKNPSATELIEAGTLRIVYKPRSASWSIAKVNNGPDTSGITFTITPAGQVQYTSTNITGTIVVQKLSYRARTLSAKVKGPNGGWT